MPSNCLIDKEGMVEDAWYHYLEARRLSTTLKTSLNWENKSATVTVNGEILLVSGALRYNFPILQVRISDLPEHVQIKWDVPENEVEVELPLPPPPPAEGINWDAADVAQAQRWCIKSVKV